MKFLNKYSEQIEEKKVDEKPVDLATYATVELKEIKNHKPGKLLFVFREGKKKQEFIFNSEIKEEELKPLFKALTSKRFAELANKEKEEYEKAIKGLKKEDIEKVEKPKGKDTLFEEGYKDIDEEELIGCELKVRAIDKERKGKMQKLIQSFSEVN
jgi:hypothetical protein